MAKLLAIKDIDVCAGPFLADLDTVNFLKTKSPSTGWACLAQDPLIIKNSGRKVSFIPFDGLEWEDPDRFQPEINSLGYDLWLNKYYNCETEWTKRRQAMNDMLTFISKLYSEP